MNQNRGDGGCARRPTLRLAAIAFAVCTETLAASRVSAQDYAISTDDTRFASEIGAPVAPSPPPVLTPPLSPPADFRGTTGQSCASIDFNTFLHQFEPNELLAELRQSLLSGAQSAISNFLVALAYSAPTLTSILDMSDRQLGARFNAFAQTCSSEQVRAVGLRGAKRRLADASEQCFARELARGTAPTGAFRRCSVSRTFDEPSVPATLSTVDFIRRHSDLILTPHLESLLALLPDERIATGSYQVRPPQLSLESLSESVRIRSRFALDYLIESPTSATVEECGTDLINDPSALACLPRSALTVVNSSAFRVARLLGPTARSMFKDGLSSQIAVTAVYADLLELAQKIARMNLRGDSDTSAEEVSSRRDTLRTQVMRLLEEADLRVKLEETKLRSTRAQLLAIERVQRDLESKAATMRQGEVSRFGVTSFLRLFRDNN